MRPYALGDPRAWSVGIGYLQEESNRRILETLRMPVLKKKKKKKEPDVFKCIRISVLNLTDLSDGQCIIK